MTGSYNSQDLTLLADALNAALDAYQANAVHETPHCRELVSTDVTNRLLDAFDRGIRDPKQLRKIAIGTLKLH